MLGQGYATTFFRLNGRRVHVTPRKGFEVRHEQEYDAVLGVHVGGLRGWQPSPSSAEEAGCLGSSTLEGTWGTGRGDICLWRSRLRGYADGGEQIGGAGVEKA